MSTGGEYDVNNMQIESKLPFDYAQGKNTSLKRKVIVATYTNEGLSFQIHLGPLKFEPSKRGRKPVLPVATI